MAIEVLRLKLKETIDAKGYIISVTDEISSEIVQYDNGDLKVSYIRTFGGASYLTQPIPKKYTKLIIQKAQQQQ